MSEHYAMDDSSVKDGTLSMGSTQMSTLTGDDTSSNGARLLSQATSIATIAARSILSSGGSEATALKTAKAAAQSVLKAQYFGELGNGPKGIMRKRKIKRQAEVVSSMALVSAANSVRNGSNYDVLSQTHNELEHKRQLRQLQYAIKSNPSLISMATRTTETPTTPSQSIFSGLSGSVKSPMKGQANAFGDMEDIQEEESVHKAISGITSDDDKILRPVSIRVESQPKVLSPRGDKRMKRRDITSDVPDEDPIYDAASQANRHQQRNHYAAISETSSEEDTLQESYDDESLRTDKTNGTKQSFISKHVEAYLFDFTCGENACSGGEKDLTTDDEDEDEVIVKEMKKSGVIGVNLNPVESEVSSVRSHELLGELNRANTPDEVEPPVGVQKHRRKRFSFRNKVSSMIRRSNHDVRNDEEDGEDHDSEYREEYDDESDDSDVSDDSDDSDDSDVSIDTESDEVDDHDGDDDDLDKHYRTKRGISTVTPATSTIPTPATISPKNSSSGRNGKRNPWALLNRRRRGMSAEYGAN